MSDSGGGWRRRGEEGEPGEQPQGNPRDLHPTTDIRFVMVETAKLTTRVDGFADQLSKLGPLVEKALEKGASDTKDKVQELKTDIKDARDRLLGIENSISFFKGAVWVMGGLFAIALVIIGVLLKKALGA